VAALIFGDRFQAHKSGLAVVSALVLALPTLVAEVLGVCGRLTAVFRVILALIVAPSPVVRAGAIGGELVAHIWPLLHRVSRCQPQPGYCDGYFLRLWVVTSTLGRQE
jgi:hypothetical protein